MKGTTRQRIKITADIPVNVKNLTFIDTASVTWAVVADPATDAAEVSATATGGGGGTSDHALLSHLSWSASGHTGTASRVAGFDGTGAAAYLTGSTVVGYVATTAGDLVYGDGAGGATRLPIGSVNRLLSSSGTAPQWSTPSDVRTMLSLVVGTDVPSYTDPRLSNARTPTVHASSHQHGGSDEIATAIPAANAIPKADEWGSLSPWTFSPLTWVGWIARASGTSFQWLGDTGFATGGTATPGNTLTQTVWSISGAGSAASCRAANQDVRIGHSVISEGCFVTSSSLASIRIWAGMANALGTGATPTGDSAGLNFDPALSANAQVFAYDGTTISRTDTGVTIATNTVYRYQVYLTTAGVQARIWVAGSAVPAWVSHATNLPRASINMWSGVFTLINTAAGTKSLGVVSVGARWRLNDA